MESRFVPQWAKQLLNKLDSQDLFKKIIKRMLISWISYMVLTTRMEQNWINSVHGSDDQLNINIDNLFDELSLAKTLLASKKEEWETEKD